jgi:hypothetical protein
MPYRIVIVGVALSVIALPVAAQTCTSPNKIEYRGTPTPYCCTTGAKTGCVRNADDCAALKGKSATGAGCNKVFPDYSGRVAAVPEVDLAKLCSAVAGEAVWRPDGRFTKDGDTCRRDYTCTGRTVLSESQASICKPVFNPTRQTIRGTCLGPNCVDCKTDAPSEKCTVTFVKK